MNSLRCPLCNFCKEDDYLYDSLFINFRIHSKVNKKLTKNVSDSFLSLAGLRSIIFYWNSRQISNSFTFPPFPENICKRQDTILLSGIKDTFIDRLYVFYCKECLGVEIIDQIEYFFKFVPVDN